MSKTGKGRLPRVYKEYLQIKGNLKGKTKKKKKKNVRSMQEMLKFKVPNECEWK